jgi:hypothetical protein
MAGLRTCRGPAAVAGRRLFGGPLCRRLTDTLHTRVDCVQIAGRPQEIARDAIGCRGSREPATQREASACAGLARGIAARQALRRIGRFALAKRATVQGDRKQSGKDSISRS